jgi:diguanylate cyclase (GGDEF)-like protein
VSNLLPKGEFASRLREMTESGRYARSRQCVLVVSIDDSAGFKRSRGGRAGEEAIATVARALLRSPSGTAMPLLQPSDIVGRHGEDQLAVLLGPDVDRESATVVAEQILDGLLRGSAHADCPPLGLSIGVALLPIHAPTVEGLLFAAERAANLARRNGGQRVQLAEAVRP